MKAEPRMASVPRWNRAKGRSPPPFVPTSAGTAVANSPVTRPLGAEKNFLEYLMKKLSYLAIAGLMVANFAAAIDVPGWERPIQGAELTLAEDSGAVDHVATYLTLNQQDGATSPTSFTLTEDTGIRCITTPCPSSREVGFTITGPAKRVGFDTIQYHAVEVLKDIPPHVRIARRHLTVTESSMELVAPGGGGFTRRTYWQVEVKPFAQETQVYYGNPEPLASIQ